MKKHLNHVVLLLTLFYCNISFAQNIPTRDLSTDKSRYAPGAIVNFTAKISSYTSGLSLNVEYWYLTEKVATQTVNASSATVIWQWPTPNLDFRGYTVVVKLMSGTTLKGKTTIGVDVSSDWKKFPRYGFLSNYNFVSSGTQDAVLDNLNRHHINGLQFYDWMEKHHIPLGGSTTPPSQWKAIDEKPVSFGTVQNYITKAHDKNMMAMWYDLIYGAMESNSNNLSNEGVQWAWYLYNNQSHTDRWNYDLTFWNGKRIYFTNPGNTDWQNYFFKNIEYLYKNLGFDGFHMDQIGDWGVKYDYNGKSVPYYEGYGQFIGNYLTKFPQKRAVMNAVSQYGQNFISVKNVDFAYTECWTWNDWEKTYKELASIIRNNYSWSGGKSSVLAAYINYKNPNSNYFNDASVLRANAVIFAWGGAHIELGEHMLSNEYYPDNRMQMTDNLKNELVKYYDFLTAYENLLRGDGSISEKTMNNSDIVTWSNITTGKIATFNVSTTNQEVFHFLNFNGSDNLGWRDDNGSSQHVPTEKTNLNISFTVSSPITKLYWASPDQSTIELKEVPFTQNGNTVTCSLPSVKYWSMLVADKTPCTNDCPPVSTYPTLYLAGSFTGSNWSPANNTMKLIQDYTWQITGIQLNAGNYEIKFANSANWTGTDWGLATGTEGTAKVSTGTPGSNILFTIAQSGKYTFTFNDKTLAYSIVPDGLYTGIERKNGLNQISFYPNPVTSGAILNNLDQLVIKTVKITNILGENIRTENFGSSSQYIQLNLEDIPEGIYFLQVEHSKGNNILRFIKK